MVIRPVTAEDIPSLYKICLQTADAGEDATPIIRHRQLIGDFYVAPYITFEHSIGFVIEQNATIAGYIVGVAETRAYLSWFYNDWLPRLRQQYPATLITKGVLEQALLEQLYRPMEVNDYFEDYPSHLHVNLLPQAQGQGFGTQLIQTFTETAAQMGANGIHLDVSILNRRAMRFYERLGFQVLSAVDDALILGKRL